ncbi:hypothetical protein Tco_0752052 [Tanacetum coccineum]|uniref:Uncharacterized protein n=1 Tax=Tanacetum coccineum TaxID=301880 RepID=A0ABQ4Z7E6_9ASTR
MYSCFEANMYFMFQAKHVYMFQAKHVYMLQAKHEKLVYVGAKYVGVKHDSVMFKCVLFALYENRSPNLETESGLLTSQIMNPQETEQVVACDQLWVPTTERVNISTTNVRLKPQSGIHHIRSKDSESYEVLLANKKYVIDVEVLGRSLIFVPKKEESYKLFILYSTSQIPPKKSRGKGLQGKKTADTTEESVEKATISVDDNIIPEPDIALELGKSISLVEAEEEVAAREVHDTHARIMTESVLEPARTIRQFSIAFRDTSSVSKKRRLVRPKAQGHSISH